MYKLLVVDDEEIEREGMAHFIPWKKYGIELAGESWNGADAFEKIKKIHPDIVITDIKMPVMDGLELIRRTAEVDDAVKFIVLSGYGDFEYTSQAMESGIKHYILKPCDEKKIIPVVQTVLTEIEDEQEKINRENEYVKTVQTLLPRAREQLFRNMLLGREKAENDILASDLLSRNLAVSLLAFRVPDDFDYLEQIRICNFLENALGEENLLFDTSIGHDFLFLLNISNKEASASLISNLERSLPEFKTHAVFCALSRTGTVDELPVLYAEVTALILISAKGKGSCITEADCLSSTLQDALLPMNRYYLKCI